MNILNKDTVALVVKTEDRWETVCVTEYGKDGTWHCGMNLIVSVKDMLETAEKNKLSIIFEKTIQEKNNEKTN